jgi:hypothetical protein
MKMSLIPRSHIVIPIIPRSVKARVIVIKITLIKIKIHPQRSHAPVTVVISKVK